MNVKLLGLPVALTVLFAVTVALAQNKVTVDGASAAPILDAKLQNRCAPWDGPAAEARVTLPDGKFFVAQIYQLDELDTGITLNNAPADSWNVGSASICKSIENNKLMDCETTTARISVNNVKDNDSGSGTLSIEGIGAYTLRVHWDRTGPSCG